MSLACGRAGCLNPLTVDRDTVCPGDFTVLAATCRGKLRLSRPAARVHQVRGYGAAYRCLLCRSWHTGTRPGRHAELRTTVRGTIQALRADPRCGPAGLRQLAQAWDPARVNRESWALGLDQSAAHVVPWR